MSKSPTSLATSPSFDMETNPTITPLISLLSECKPQLKLFTRVIDQYKTYCIIHPANLQAKAVEIASLWEYAYKMANTFSILEEKNAGLTALIILMSNNTAKYFLSISGKTELQSEIMTLPTISKSFSQFGAEHFDASDIFVSPEEAEYYLIRANKFEE